MTDKLPPNLLALFAARPPLRWLEHPDYAPEKRRTAAIQGLAAFLPELQKYKETDEYTPTESWLEARDRKRREKEAAVVQLRKDAPTIYKPSEDPNIRGDAFKTMIVARLSYEADERDLEREFGRFGPIERIRIVKDTHAHEKPSKKKKAHRGYAFVVFEREKDMRAALDSCDGIRIKDRNVKLDVERGRTVRSWLPRRLGGGLGGRGYTKAVSSRPMGGGFGGGGYRGGFRGFDGGGRGRGGFRGGFGGGRGGGFKRDGGGDFGGPRGGDRDRGFGNGPPRDAPLGPGSDRRNGGERSFGGGNDRDRPSYDDRRGGGGYRGGDRFGGGGGGDRENRRTGSNMEPIGGRREVGHRDRDRERERGPPRDHDRPPRDDDSRKRAYDGGGYDDSRKSRRY